MPLNILLPMVVIGIATITIVLHLLGLSRRITLIDADAARAAWDREFPADPAAAATLSHDHHAALIETATGGHGIVFPMGADTTARYLAGARLHETARGLSIALPDFTAPRIRLRLDTDEAARWPQMMKDTA
jgi:hypothetical protein